MHRDHMTILLRAALTMSRLDRLRRARGMVLELLRTHRMRTQRANRDCALRNSMGTNSDSADTMSLREVHTLRM